MNKLGIFLPDSNFIITIDMISIIFIIFDILYIPLEISMEINFPDSIKLTELIIEIFFLFDMVLIFNTAYYHKGTLVKNRPKIFTNYVKFWFWIDLLSILPFDIFFDEEQKKEG